MKYHNEYKQCAPLTVPPQRYTKDNSLVAQALNEPARAGLARFVARRFPILDNLRYRKLRYRKLINGGLGRLR